MFSNNLDVREFSNCLEAARYYTNSGLCVIPLEGKRPFLKDWTTTQLREADLPFYFSNGNNIGIILGEASGGLVDVDLDNPLAVRIAPHLLPDTLSSGRQKNPHSHRWYLTDPLAKNAKYAVPKDMAHRLGIVSATLLELRSTGHQTAVAPSVHPDEGDRYSWHSGRVSAIEGALLEERVRKLATATLLAHFWHEGTRQEFVRAAAGYLGRRMDPEDVEEILLAAAKGVEDEECSKRVQAVEDTISNLSKDKKVTGGPTLDKLAPGVTSLMTRWWGWKETSSTKRSAPSKDKERVPTHDELRDRWLEKYPHTAFGREEWQRYDNGVWTPVSDLMIKSEITQTLEEAKSEGVSPSSSLVVSVENLARNKTFVTDERWDSNEDILVLANGTLEISSGTLREHRPSDYATTALAFPYNPEASCPTWERYLESTVPEVRDFLQEFAGYCLTVDTSHEIAVWLYGPPGSGKSTFIEGLRAMLGDRAGSLGLADIQRNRFALANLPGKTLVLATEQPSDFVSCGHLLNAIISGEVIQVEKKFRDAYSLTPTAKLCWAMNDLPRIADANSGLFRRVKVIEFSDRKTKTDPEVKEKIKKEGEGIFMWALGGLRRVRVRGGFEIPQSVKTATAEFLKTNDVPKLFVEEACHTGEDYKVQAAKLYEAYKIWCEENGHRPKSSTAVANDWERLGFKKRKSNGGRYFYFGLEVFSREEELLAEVTLGGG